MADQLPLVGPAEFTEAFANLASGVVVVCVRDGRDDVGITATSFVPASLDPPLALVAVAAESYLSEVLHRCDRWAATLLASGQEHIASRFAMAGRPSGRLLVAGLPHHRGPHSEALIVDGGVGAVECATVQRSVAGDHTLFVGRVESVDYVNPSVAPLVRLRGRYHSVPAHP